MKQAMLVCVSVTSDAVTDNNNSQSFSDISNRQPTITYELSSSYDYFYSSQPETIPAPLHAGGVSEEPGGIVSHLKRSASDMVYVSYTGSHSFTCHPHTNHTCHYSSAAEHHRPFTGTPVSYTHLTLPTNREV